MFGAGKNMHRAYGVVLYLAVVMFLYGKREVLPKSVIKNFDNKNEPGLKAKKRDPKRAVFWGQELGNQINVKGGGVTMYQAGKQLKQQQKDK